MEARQAVPGPGITETENTNTQRPQNRPQQASPPVLHMDDRREVVAHAAPPKTWLGS